MANPQKENGHIDIANEIADRFCQFRINGEEWLILWTILRKTWGWHKKQDYISVTQFQKSTGLKRGNVYRSIKGLLSRGIIAIIKDDNTNINLYKFNKDFDQWKPCLPIIKDDNNPIIKDDNKSVITGDTHKRKERNNTPYSPPILPDDFLLFWPAYPKHIGKQAALKAWLNAKKKGILPPIEIILLKIQDQKQSEQWKKDNGQYIPNPTTWINQGRWDDEPLKKSRWK